MRKSHLYHRNEARCPDGVAQTLARPSLAEPPRGTDHRRPPPGETPPPREDESSAHTVRGVARRLNQPERERSRGTHRAVRGIVEPEQLLPWRNSEAQQIFLAKASKADRIVYRRLSESIYSAAAGFVDAGGAGMRSSVPVDVGAVLRSFDTHRIGHVSRRDFHRALHGLNHGLSVDCIEDLLCRRLDSRGDKSVDVELFISIFVNDQRRSPAGGGGGGSDSARVDDERDRRAQEQQQSPPATLNREQYLRELVKDAGGEECQWR
jgi:hypothetical protein